MAKKRIENKGRAYMSGAMESFKWLVRTSSKDLLGADGVSGVGQTDQTEQTEQARQIRQTDTVVVTRGS